MFTLSDNKLIIMCLERNLRNIEIYVWEIFKK